jgi:leucine-rich repeat-containing protein 49
MAQPERLNLDRRGLSALCHLPGEAALRLLSYQHNRISALAPAALATTPQLLFLDLFDNQLGSLAGLDGAPRLRVFLAGRNQLGALSGLEGAPRLDVLDLHANRLRSLDGLGVLRQLRVLNLAGNQLRSLSGLAGLNCLAELNLRRNLIDRLDPLPPDALPALQRLFLSHNLLAQVCLHILSL